MQIYIFLEKKTTYNDIFVQKREVDIWENIIWSSQAES